MATVSIIIPVYKVEDYLDECVQSILKQTYTDIEIILVDDGSPDRCGEMCDAYAELDKRVCVVHKTNGGLGDARNAGVKAAHGEYLLFIDSDDWLRPDAVELLVKEAERYQADVLVFDYVGVEPGGVQGGLFSLDIQQDKVLNADIEPRLIMSSVSAVNKLYRRTFWENSGICFPKGRYYEDLGTLPKLLLLARRIVYKKEVLYYYRMREGSIMHSADFSKNYQDRTAMLDEVRNFFRKQGVEQQHKDELEYLFFENGYFVPSKEIVLNEPKSPYLRMFREYAYKNFPNINKNKYIRELSKKDKILWRLLGWRWYWMMRFLSSVRQFKDKLALVRK